MYNHKDIFMVKHTGCLDCGKLEEQLIAGPMKITVPSVTLGAGASEPNEMSRIAKRINGKWLQLYAITPGFPFVVFDEQYVLCRPMAMHLCHSDIDELITVAREDWRAFPQYFDYAEKWYRFIKEKQGKYYELRDSMIKDLGPEVFYEITSVCRMCTENNMAFTDPQIEHRIIEIIISGELRRIHKVGGKYSQ